MIRRTKIISALGLAMAIGAAAPGCMVSGSAGVSTGYVAYEAPPPPQAEQVEIRPGYVWIHGRWNWQGGQWAWLGGHYERERAGYAWQDGAWTQSGNQWHWNDGTWIVGGATVTTAPMPPDRAPAYNGGVDRYGNPIAPSPTPPPPAQDYGPPPPPAPPPAPAMYPMQPPPPAQVEAHGARSGYVWVGGNYQWNAGAYVWVPGHWERERANMVWEPGRWDLQAGHYVWIEGHWGTRDPRDHRH